MAKPLAEFIRQRGAIVAAIVAEATKVKYYRKRFSGKLGEGLPAAEKIGPRGVTTPAPSRSLPLA
jgi:hypothetical protein